MKYTICFLVIALCVGNAEEKKKPSCCGESATEEFAAFAADPMFVAKHEAPLPFTYKVGGGVMKEIPSPDSKNANIFEVKPDSAGNKVVFMVHEWWGLNDYIKQEAEKLQKELGNVTVIALDLYDGKVATDAAVAGKYVSEVTEKRAQAIIQAAIQYVGKDAQVATIGWCFGGGWSMQSALLLGKQASGCVMYYGMPESDTKRLATLNCDVLGIFGSQDKWITAKVIKDFQANMKKVKKNLEVKVYDADHAFANPSNPHYDKEKSADAHALALKFLKSKLGV